MSAGRLAGAVALVLMALLPLVASEYMLHIAIQILIWGFVYTAWSMMGRFGLTSFGHGAFLGVGAYLPALLWNFYGLTPWLGIPAGMLLAVLLALVIGYPSFRLRVVGHYFALVTLALSQVVLLSLIAARDVTGGSLGMTLEDGWPLLVRAAIHAKELFLYRRAGGLDRRSRRLAVDRPRHLARRAGSDLRGRNRCRRGRHRCDARKTTGHRDQRRADGPRRKPA